MDHRTTDIFGQPIKPETLAAKRNATLRARRVAATPTPTLNPPRARLEKPKGTAVRTDRTPFLIAAESGAFKMKGLDAHWRDGRLAFAINAGPCRADSQQSLQRIMEGELMNKVKHMLPVAAASHVESPLRSSQARERHDHADDAHSKLLALHQRTALRKNPDASVPNLLHPDDPSYVDTYRNYLQDREERLDFKQRRAYLDHDRFVVNPATKLQTLREQKEALHASLKPRIVNPADDPSLFMPPTMLPRTHHRRTIEDCEETDTRDVMRQVFTEELQRLCRAKPAGFFEGKGSAQRADAVAASPTSDNRFVREVLTPSLKLPAVTAVGDNDHLPGYASPARVTDSWATQSRATAYPFQKYKAMHKYAEDKMMTAAVSSLIDGRRSQSTLS